jgi:hypothetical protein
MLPVASREEAKLVSLVNSFVRSDGKCLPQGSPEIHRRFCVTSFERVMTEHDDLEG